MHSWLVILRKNIHDPTTWIWGQVWLKGIQIKKRHFIGSNNLCELGLIGFPKFIKNQGYFQAQSYHTLFVKSSNNENLTILVMYVKDIILIRDDHTKIELSKRKLAKEFEIKDLAELHYFLAWSKKGIFVSQ